jgi:DNA-binding NtrC family response regulator
MTPAIILVVDDDTPMRSSMRRSLEREGYTVIEAGNANEALAQLKHTPAQLVITDIIMPDADGLELVFALHRSHPAIKIIAISGGGQFAPEFHLDLASRAGASAVLSKPFQTDVLLNQVRTLLAKAS